MNRLFTIASELSNIAQERFEIKQKLSLYEMQQSARETAMIPEGGWPGSNDTQRKSAEKTAKANDPELIGLSMSIHDLNYDTGQLEVDRDALIAERDAFQWTIRDRETTKPPDGHRTSVFEDYDLWQDEQYSAEIDKKAAE